MIHIDEPRLESDLAYRFDYLTRFLGFSEQDIQAIHGAANLLAPCVPKLVDAVYSKLHSFDSTWRHFFPRQHGFQGAIPDRFDGLDENHPQIHFRKEHLKRYLVSLVTKPYDIKMVEYLDMVGKIHTDKAGSKEIQVPLVQMNALLGFVADALTATILGLGLPRGKESDTLRAFQKLLRLQNDFINRHYQKCLVEVSVGSN
ncbi:MAG: hypothetical protein EXR99_05000 [Gemmataceae bacterium]|nr:hypothetical protein [Gemmataceae bacterium]